MNDTLKGVAHIGAELAAAKADLQREMERHRKTWRQLEQVTGLLRRARWKLWTSPGDTLPDDITAALSQQAEPVEPAPAQDEREAPEVVGCLMLGGIEHWSDGPEYGDIDIAPCVEVIRNAQVRLVTSGDDVHLDLMTVAQHERIVAALTRPAQTEQQPVTVPEGWKLVPSEPTRAMCLAAQRERREYPVISDRDSPVVLWRAMLSAAPIAQTAPQPEQSGLVDALETISRGAKRHFEQGKAPDMTTLSYWSGIAGAALSATPIPATAPSHE